MNADVHAGIGNRAGSLGFRKRGINRPNLQPANLAAASGNENSRSDIVKISIRLDLPLDDF